MKRKAPEVVYAPITACPNCGGMRCAVLMAIREHPDGMDGNMIIGTLLNIVAELLSAAPSRRDAEAAELVKDMFVERLADLRAMPETQGETKH